VVSDKWISIAQFIKAQAMTNKSEHVWFITGCSTGFGQEIARHAFDLGYRVVATARRPSQIDILGADGAVRLLKLPLDVTKSDEVRAAVAAAEGAFGRIDVLVNNAGVGYFGAIEESDENDVRRMFEINFWGLVAVTRAAIPGMRRRRFGCIVNLSSVGGLRGAAGVGFYNATKFAIEGFSEALAAEMRPLGVKVLLVEPSGFRTDWAGRSASAARIRIDDYASTAGTRCLQIRENSGKQPGDPARAAAAIVSAVEAPTTPLRLLLGKAAVAAGREKIQALTRDFAAWESVAEAADFPK
jgi:NAD(P)-dependent dehydrogenase (short-subunit alcohol dehydrogenase family)